MRKAHVFVNGTHAGILEEISHQLYRFIYDVNYDGAPVSLTMPVLQQQFEYNRFPPFFEGLLPEGIMLEALLRIHKLDRRDYFGQLIKVGRDMVGAVTVEEMA